MLEMPWFDVCGIRVRGERNSDLWNFRCTDRRPLVKSLALRDCVIFHGIETTE